MLCRNVVITLQETFLSLVLKDSKTPKQPADCFLNPPCGCSNPGQALQCEDCPYLEGCLSRFKTAKGVKRTMKWSIPANPKTKTKPY